MRSVSVRRYEVESSSVCGLFMSCVVYVGSESVWGVLSGQVSVDNCPSAVMHDVRELETWMLRLLSTPVAVPGKTRIEVSQTPAWPDNCCFFLIAVQSIKTALAG